MECDSNINFELNSSCEEFKFNNPKFSFEDGLCYRNNVYYGKIIELTESKIKVEVDNGNKYMKGLINEFLIIKQ